MMKTKPPTLKALIQMESDLYSSAPIFAALQCAHADGLIALQLTSRPINGLRSGPGLLWARFREGSATVHVAFDAARNQVSETFLERADLYFRAQNTPLGDHARRHPKIVDLPATAMVRVAPPDFGRHWSAFRAHFRAANNSSSTLLARIKQSARAAAFDKAAHARLPTVDALARTALVPTAGQRQFDRAYFRCRWRSENTDWAHRTNVAHMSLLQNLRAQLGERFAGGFVREPEVMRAAPHLVDRQRYAGTNAARYEAESAVSIISAYAPDASTQIEQQMAAGRCLVVFAPASTPSWDSPWVLATDDQSCMRACVRLLEDREQRRVYAVRARQHHHTAGEPKRAADLIIARVEERLDAPAAVIRATRRSPTVYDAVRAVSASGSSSVL